MTSTRAHDPLSGPGAPTAPRVRSVVIPAGTVVLEGDLVVPDAATGVVLFVHGSGSSRFSARNQHVARLLQDAGFATLLFDLLTRGEEATDAVTARYRFNIPLLTERLCDATVWAGDQPELRGLSAGYFGASTGAAAALIAAALAPAGVAAVVSRGGRPDLAGEHLLRVRAPTLLVVGGADPEVVALNQSARRAIRAPCELVIVPGATHLFAEPGALDQVATLATAWFARYLGRDHDRAGDR
jgi:pimeloyl-ACP methyl ester carboxylesterase